MVLLRVKGSGGSPPHAARPGACQLLPQAMVNAVNCLCVSRVGTHWPITGRQFVIIKYSARLWAAVATVPVLLAVTAIPASAAPVVADSQPPTAPRLLHIAGLGGCEIDMRIALSADESGPASAVRYVVSANGSAIETVHADTRGSAPGFGNLDVFASPAGGRQTFTVAGVDSDGNRSAPGNPLSRTFSSPC
jgi:hypothetical protein